MQVSGDGVSWAQGIAGAKVLGQVLVESICKRWTAGVGAGRDACLQVQALRPGKAKSGDAWGLLSR